MATLIAVYNSEGCVGRCDAKCYDAQHADCDCICGGHNHGAGQKQAIENTRELAGSWLQAFASHKGLASYTSEIGEVVNQLSLFDV